MFRAECKNYFGDVFVKDFKDVEDALEFAEEKYKFGWLYIKVSDEYGNTIVEYKN